MPSGTPDFGRAEAAATTHQLADLAESAARTGSISTFHRGGEIVYLDDFEAAVLHWSTNTSGTGAAVALSTAFARSGNQSLLLTAGSDSSRLADIRRGFGTPSGDRIGVEVSFATDGGTEEFQINIFAYDGTNVREFRVVFDDANNRVDILDASGTEKEVISGLEIPEGQFLFNTVKVIVNRTTGEYVRLFYNNAVVDLSADSGESSVSALDPRILVRFRQIGTSGLNEVIYLEDVIITQNEP